MRTLALTIALTIAFFSAQAQAGSYRWDKELKLVEAGCTDLFDTDADGNPTPNGRDITDATDWDTIGEVVDIFANYDAPASVSGNPDGFCDAEPWVIQGDIVLVGANEDLYIGPIPFPPQGTGYVYFVPTVITNYNFLVLRKNPFNAGIFFTHQATNAQTSTVAEPGYWGPREVTSNGNIAAGDDDEAPFFVGEKYMFIDLNGAGTWAVNFAWLPVHDPDNP